MRRQFNYTYRKRILESKVNFRLLRDNHGKRYFDGNVDLTDLELPSAAKLYVEAFHGRSLARFDFGTVNQPLVPADRSVEAVDFADRLTFRVKVVDESGVYGRILALAEAVDVELLPFKDSGNRKPLLPVSYSRSMEEEIWRVRFLATGPVLEVNATIPGISAVVESDRVFAALVRPAALRAVLQQLLLVEGMTLEDAGYGTWQGRWLLFAQGHLDAPLSPLAEADEKVEWIDECVRRFASLLRARTNYVQTSATED